MLPPQGHMEKMLSGKMTLGGHCILGALVLDFQAFRTVRTEAITSFFHSRQTHSLIKFDVKYLPKAHVSKPWSQSHTTGKQ